MKPTVNEYDKLAKKASPPSKIWKDCLCAFLVGGALCTIGQGLANLFLHLGFLRTNAMGMVSVCLIALSAVLTGLGVYDKIAKFAGAGTLVPITGFANAVVAPALEFKSEGLVLGLGAKLFILAGPVITYGITASIVWGIIKFIFGL